MTTPLDARLQALLDRGGLPAPSDTALEVLRLGRAEAATLDDLAAALDGDPPLCHALFRFAGSPVFGIGEEIRSPRRAALVLGLRSVQLLALALSLLDSVPRRGALGRLDCALFWRRAVVRAVSARALADLAGGAGQDEAFALGLLGELGRVALAGPLADVHEPVQRAAERRGSAWPAAEVERELLGFDHVDVGAALLAGRELVPMLALVARHARDPRRLPPDVPAELAQLARQLHAAECVTELLTRAPSAAALAHVHERVLGASGLDTVRAEGLLVALERPIRHTAELLELEPWSGPGIARVLAAARAGDQTSAAPAPSPR